MGNVRTFTAIVLIALLPSACTEDENWSNLEKAVNVENSLGLEGPRGDLKLRLDLTKPELKFRVDELRDSITQFMTPEFLLLQELGRQILRERGVNPDTAFSGGINDPRLAKIPAAANMMDSINAVFMKQGLMIKAAYRFGEPQARTPTGEDTKGPFDDYWANLLDNGAVLHTEKDKYECLAQELANITVVVGVAQVAATKLGVAGSILIGVVGSGPAITVAAGITIVGALYFARRMEQCLAERERLAKETCSLTITIEEDCKQQIERDGIMANAWCHRYLIDLMVAKWNHLEARLGMDTLQVVVDPAFNTDVNLN